MFWILFWVLLYLIGVYTDVAIFSWLGRDVLNGQRNTIWDISRDGWNFVITLTALFWPISLFVVTCVVLLLAIATYPFKFGRYIRNVVINAPQLSIKKRVTAAVRR